MSDKLSLKKHEFFRRAAALIAAAGLFASMSACSGQPAQEETTSPTSVKTFAPPTPSPTPPPTEAPSPTPPPTRKPTPVISFPPFEADASGNYIYPQVFVDRTEAMTNEAVNFKILTSENVNSIQTVIDGEPYKIYKDYVTDKGMRIWQTHIYFTNCGSRRVQFKCAMASGGTAIIPDKAIKISVTFDYTAESTSKEISSGKTVTFTLKTPDIIDSVDAVVDGVKQNIPCDEPDSEEEGVRTWKLNVTFFKTGTRTVTFEAYDGTKLKETFPKTGITIIVQ
jgi:hypothetical protein